jgi:hypothetical protein
MASSIAGAKGINAFLNATPVAEDGGAAIQTAVKGTHTAAGYANTTASKLLKAA